MYEGRVYEAPRRKFVIHGNLLDGRKDTMHRMLHVLADTKERHARG